MVRAGQGRAGQGRAGQGKLSHRTVSTPWAAHCQARGRYGSIRQTRFLARGSCRRIFTARRALCGVTQRIVTLRSLLASVACEAAALLLSEAAWDAYGYVKTGDWPSTGYQALAQLVLYGPGMLVFGAMPSVLAFFVTAGLIARFYHAPSAILAEPGAHRFSRSP